MNNDFAEVLRDFINTLGVPLKCKLDYLSEHEGLVLYPLPGGKIEKEYLNGKQDISLVFEVAIKTTDHQKTSRILWSINHALAGFNFDLPSKNNSYEFRGLEVSQPFLNDRDEQGFYIYMLDVTAKIETYGGI
ncbi:minor capsid protein [Streptococcus porcinus]|uniref:minor capsid protein n=1 Tax=Streptococcus porcinus TaxID=1340 RepID=UPI0010CAB9CF|nr:minor capsid protein [Streptococcus porcinus]VTS32674.1 minor capsid protein [Streptococcus porcinus]